jgi:hypothetical protein
VLTLLVLVDCGGAQRATSQRLRPNAKYASGPMKFTHDSIVHIDLLPRS